MDGMLDFGSAVLEELNRVLPDGKTGTLKTVERFNGVVLEAIAVGNEKDYILPTVYLDEYHAAFQDKRITVNGIVSDILRRLEEGTKTEAALLGLPYGDWKAVKGRVIFQLINMDMNQKVLEDIPHVPYLDLAAVFRIILEYSNGTFATVLVRNGLARQWGMTPVDLMAWAEKNTPRLLPEKIQSMDSLLRERYEGTEWDLGMPMHILSNSTGLYGSGVVLYQDFLREMSVRLGGGFYLLPSSVHEWIAVPETKAGFPEELSQMVREVNAEAVLEEEILSDHAYYYDHGETKVRCI